MASTAPPANNTSKPRGKLKVVQLPGTKISAHNSQLLVSTGVPSFDSLLRGGVPVGSLILVNEDVGATYSDIFMKCFLAEGVVCKHKIHLASLDKDAKSVLSNLPAPDIKKEKAEDSLQSDESDKMEIAWRYQNQKKVDSSTVNSFGHNYDIRSKMPEDMIKGYENSFWIPSEKDPYNNLSESLHQVIDDNKLFTKYNRTEANVIRIAVHSIASPLWGMEAFSNDQKCFRKLTTFLVHLRALARRSFTVAMVTIPSHLMTYEPLLEDLHRSADFVIGFESFEGTDKEVNPVFKDYHGLLHLTKISPINSLASSPLENADWVFKLKRKKLVIEKLHIPPDLSETVSRSQGKKDTLSCSSAVDF